MNGIKKFFREFVLTRKIYAKLIDIKAKKLKKANLQKDGLAVIAEMQEILENGGVKFFFDMGTLLGIIREGRLLKHDMDIDVAVFADSEDEKERVTKLLVAKGCEEYLRYSADGLGIVEQSFVYYNIKFDINYYYRGSGTDVCYLLYSHPDKIYEEGTMSIVMLSCPTIEETKKFEFQGITVNVPTNAEAYLAVRYGENWRIPDKKYIYWKGPSTSPTDYIGKRTVISDKWNL